MLMISSSQMDLLFVATIASKLFFTKTRENFRPR